MARILLVGDSITVGYPPDGGPGFRRWLKDAAPSDTYVGPFESPAGSDLFHGGIGGATTFTFSSGGSAHLFDWLLAYKPDIVRLQIGTNDLISFPHDKVEYAIDRLTSLVATGAGILPRAHWHISSIPLGGGLDFQTRVRAFNAALLDRITKKEALRETAPLASFRDNCVYLNRAFDADGLTAVLTAPPDGTHPNTRGYALLARGILEQMGRPVSATLIAAGQKSGASGGSEKKHKPRSQSGGGGMGTLVVAAVTIGAGALLLRGRR